MTGISWKRMRGLGLALAVALALGSAACSSPNQGSDQTTTVVPEPPDTGESVSPKGKKWEGWRWQGDRDNCYFVFKNQCFATEDDACKAAECGDKGCSTSDGAPAIVSCRE